MHTPTHTHPHPSILSVTYRRDHDQSYQEADDADKQQQQLSAVASSDLMRVQVSHRRHQGLQTHKLGDRGETGSAVRHITHQCHKM